MSQDAVIEKIKKLLRMKRGGTPGEIANALAMAAELARKHGIDLDAVDPDAPDAKPLGHADAILSSRLQDECKYAALVCQNFFNVEALITNCPARSCRRRWDWQIIFIGTEWDRQIAIYIFEFLSAHFRRCWNHRANKRIRNRAAFMNGIYQGLCQKLRAQRAVDVAGTGLLRLDQQAILRRNYLKTNWPDSGEQKMPDASDASVAKYAGWAEGKKTEIRSGLDGAAGRGELPPPVRQLPAPNPQRSFSF